MGHQGHQVHQIARGDGEISVSVTLAVVVLATRWPTPAVPYALTARKIPPPPASERAGLSVVTICVIPAVLCCLPIRFLLDEKIPGRSCHMQDTGDRTKGQLWYDGRRTRQMRVKFRAVT